MLLNSYEFILLFLPLTLLAYYGSAHRWGGKTANCILFLMSLFFYGYASVSALGILLVTTVLNHFAAGQMHRSAGNKKALLAVSLVLNVAVLAFFKYFSMMSGLLEALSGGAWRVEALVLPLGISFTTFQQIAFLVDSYRGQVPRYSLLDYALYVTFFPKVASGPIVLPGQLIPQLQDDSRKIFRFENLSRGLFAFAIGLAEKVLLADVFGTIVDYGYSHLSTLNTLEALMTILGYTFQVYFDFDGYCGMAMGVSLMLGLELPVNFNTPYRASNILDFWKRWHMTLTNFLTRYVYFSLGGNRKGTVRTYINVMIVFLVSGIWHGAGTNFLIWGALHGLASVVTRMVRKSSFRMPRALSWVLFFGFLNITWMFFRAPDFSDVGTLLGRIFAGGFTINYELFESLCQPTLVNVLRQLLTMNGAMAVLYAGSLALSTVARSLPERLETFAPGWGNLLMTAILLILGILSLSGVSSFLYTNF